MEERHVALRLSTASTRQTIRWSTSSCPLDRVLTGLHPSPSGMSLRGGDAVGGEGEGRVWPRGVNGDEERRPASQRRYTTCGAPPFSSLVPLPFLRLLSPRSRLERRKKREIFQTDMFQLWNKLGLKRSNYLFRARACWTYQDQGCRERDGDVTIVYFSRKTWFQDCDIDKLASNSH